MPTNRYEGNLQVNGDLIVTGDFAPPAACIGNAAIEAAAEIDQTKLEHRLNLIYSQQVGVAALTESRVLYRCYPAGGATVVKFGAASVTVAGAATTVTVDLKKNGASILTATFALDSGNVAYTLEDAPGFSSTALVQGDVLTVHLTLAGANAPQGVFVNLIIEERGT